MVAPIVLAKSEKLIVRVLLEITRKQVVLWQKALQWQDYCRTR